MAATDPSDSPSTDTSDGPSDGIQRDLDELTILLVEDDPRAAKWVRLALEERGAKILWATRIDQARLLVERHEPELALLDVSLPDGNGLDLIVELRTREHPCACVVLTGNPESNVARIAAGLGVSEFLAKPVELERLHVAVTQARERTLQMRRILAEHKGSAVQNEIEDGVGKRLARAREQAPGKPVDSSERLASLAAEFGLSARQAQAVAGVAEGLSDADIARAMKVSYSRTRQLLAAAFSKLGLKSRNDFIRFLWERSGQR
ncbi:Transcriptional regulatory protein DpiA [Enhygromyxa salina]|uniref:Transcriptional regulatory protein DpiA n=1 Tax=Enhygromyxa salina TaxID=215803 RepID=A0A2S9YD48_9BACT|nr:response regulator [Enhygromyxa salina]PRQ03023.1 Transcriptional regulatory protein DpiA [Enhygromyxa salina]